MGIFSGNIFGTGENPCVSASRGELFVPIGDEEHPPLAKWIIIGFLTVAALISLLLFMNQRYRRSITLPERNRSMIGYSIDKIEGVPETVHYAGVDFAYKVTDFEGIINGCSYTAKMDEDALLTVTDTLLKRYGDPDGSDQMALSALTPEDIPTLGTATWTWDYGKFSVKALEDLDNWGSNVAGYYINPTYLYMDLTVTGGPDGKVDIVIRYEARPRY